MRQGSEKYHEEGEDVDVDEGKLSQNSSLNEEQENVHYNKNKKIIFWIYLLIGLLFVGAQGYLIARNWQNMQKFYDSDNFFFSNQVAYEWKQGFVTDVQVVPETQCPSGYEHAVSYSWPGTGFGCFCQPNVNSSFVLEGYCTPLLIQSQCRNIQSQDERTAHLWRNSSNICIKRSSVSFENQQKYNGKNKKCGSSQSLVIVPLSQPCPLVNLTFSLPQLEDHYLEMSDDSSLIDNLYGSFNSTSPFSFYSYPISKFTVSQHEFCLIDEDSGLTPDHSQFVLLNYEKGCEERGAFQTLDSMSEILFYSNNPNIDSLSDINGFPKPGNWIYKFGFASLPSWTYYCRHNYDGKFSIPTALRILNFDFYTGYYYIALVQILLIVTIGGAYFILGLRRIMKKEVYPVGYKQVYLPKDFCLGIVRYLIDFICKGIIFGLALYTTWVCVVNWNWFKSAINLQCADGNTVFIENVIEPFRDMYEHAIMLTISQMIVLVAIVVIDIVNFCYVYRNQLQYYLVDSYGRNIVVADKDVEWLDKERNDTDNKILKIEDIVDDDLNQPDNASEKFRVTMAMNVFEHEKNQEEVPSRGRILKKKKKKIGGFKNENKKEQLNLVPSDEFNPYNLDDPSIIGLNSNDNLFGQNSQEIDNEVNEEEVVRERRKRGGKRGRGRR